MGFDPNKHHRRSMRLRGWDYSREAVYFVTICIQYRECLLGEVVAGETVLSEFGRIVAEEWERSQIIRQEIKFDEWVIMPNHFHAIIEIVDSTGVMNTTAPSIQPIRPRMRPKSISSLMAGFKSITTARINTIRQTPGIKVWQRNFYESIIRSERGLGRVRDYIQNNPRQWEIDQLHPGVPSKW